MAFDLRKYVADTSAIEKKVSSKGYRLEATVIKLPDLGKVWYLSKSLAGVLNDIQYAIKEGKQYIKAENYPLGSYLIIASKSDAFIVVKSVFLTYKNDRIIAIRKNISNQPVWELIDKEFKKKYKHIQAMLFMDTQYFAESFPEHSYLIKHKTLKRTTVVDDKLKQYQPDSSLELLQVPVLRITTHLKPLFNKYFSINEDVLHFINVVQVEKNKINGSNMYEVFAIGAILNTLKNDGFKIEKEVAIITPYKVQKHILSDFYAKKLASSSADPKIALPNEIATKKFSVIICSLVVSSKNESFHEIQENAHIIRKIIENCYDGMIFVGNQKALYNIYGFTKDLIETTKALNKIHPISEWVNTSTYATDTLKIWADPIEMMNPDKTNDKFKKAYLEKLYKAIKAEYNKQYIPKITSLYKEYLRVIKVEQ